MLEWQLLVAVILLVLKLIMTYSLTSLSPTISTLLFLSFLFFIISFFFPLMLWYRRKELSPPLSWSYYHSTLSIYSHFNLLKITFHSCKILHFAFGFLEVQVYHCNKINYVINLFFPRQFNVRLRSATRLEKYKELEDRYYTLDLNKIASLI